MNNDSDITPPATQAFEPEPFLSINQLNTYHRRGSVEVIEGLATCGQICSDDNR